MDSIDEDEIKGDGGLDPDEVKAFLRDNLASHFASDEECVAYRYAKQSQGFDGSLADWLDLDADERAGYEAGAQGESTMKLLTCACCGSCAIGKQHWNRDKGFGLCPRCVPFILDGRDGADELKAYGTPGVNFAAPLTDEDLLAECTRRGLTSK